jgi:hypothetical protein
MYNARPGLLIGFHGCEKSRQQELLLNPASMPVSAEPFDWLGHGMYFWENNADRAMEWAIDKQNKGVIKEPAVIGAVIDLGHCCDLLDSLFIKMVKTYYTLMAVELKAVNKALPVNRNVKSDPNGDQLLRELDCATIEFMHKEIRRLYNEDIAAKGYSDHKFFESVRAMFPEGDPAYDGSGFKAKSHIQICIRNSNCIKGFFQKREELNFLMQEKDK